MVLDMCRSRTNCRWCCDKADFRFAENSSCHGFSRFCNSWHIGRRIFWFIIVLASTLMLARQLHDRFAYFVKFEVKTEIGVRTENKYLLPVVTVCNMNMFSRSLLNQMDRDLLEISSKLITWILKINQQTFFAQQTIPLNASDIYWKQVEEFEKLEKEILQRYNVTSFSVDQWIYEKGWQIHGKKNVIVDCWIGKTACSADDFVPILTPQGLCYTLNINTTYWQKSPGVEAGYSIFLDIDQSEYTAWKLDSEKQFECGAKILLHQPYDKLYTGTNLAPYIGVPPGLVSYIAARPLERTMTNEPPWQTCESDVEYPKRTCLADCTARDTLKKCNCRLWFESGTEPLCGVARTTGCLVYKETNIPSKDSNFEYQCHTGCKHSCTEKSYSVGVSYTLLVSNNTVGEFAEFLNIVTNNTNGTYTNQYIRKNILSLQIAYPDLVADTAYSTPALGVSAFLSDLGGQLGLFAGISVVTIVELLEYPFVKAYAVYTINQRRKKRRAQNRHSSTDSMNWQHEEEFGRHHNHHAEVIESQHQLPRLPRPQIYHITDGKNNARQSGKKSGNKHTSDNNENANSNPSYYFF